MNFKKRFSLLVVASLLIFSTLAASMAEATYTDSDSDTTTSSVDSITLSHSGAGVVTWTVEGTSAKGFKLVWSKTSEPTYPTRSTDKYQYFSDPATTSGTITTFDGAGTYYVRVCEYLSGSCGTYSNEITVELETDSSKDSEPVTEKPFIDVCTTHKNAEAIDYLKENNVVVGYDDGTYKPYQEINRAEFTKIIVEAISGEPDVATYNNCFSDVNEEWFAPHVCYAKSAGWIDGYPDGYFRPDRKINFVEASKIIVHAFVLPISDEYNETWYQEFVIALENAAAIPTTVTSFDKEIDRGEMAEIIWRVHSENKYEQSNSYLHVQEGKQYEDNEESSCSTGDDKTTDDTTTDDVASITLSHAGDGVMSWSIDGYSASGFKLVWSLTSGPTYPTRSTDQYQYFSGATATSGTITAFDGEGTYYVRVCEYLGGSCGTYSNEVTVDLTGSTPVTDTPVDSLSLSHSGDGVMSWSIDGYSASGFKLVWSLTSGPTYPTRSTDKYNYYSSASTTTGSIDSFDGSGTYYVRVCEYLGGACGVYSNEITVDL